MPAKHAATSENSTTGREPVGAVKDLSNTALGYLPMNEAARREWVDRKCAEHEDEEDEDSASEKATTRKYYEKRLADVERWFLAEIHASTDADGKASVVCDFW